MKKNVLKLGALALALAFVFAACSQPTETSGPAEPTIIRLYLDRPVGQTLAGGALIQVRVGQNLYVGSATTYPYVKGFAEDSDVNTGAVGAATGPAIPVDQREAVRAKVEAIQGGYNISASTTAITATRTAPQFSTSTQLPLGTASTVLLQDKTNSKYLDSGVIRLRDAAGSTGTLQTGVPIAVTTDSQYYVDIELLNRTLAAKDLDSIYSGDISGYIELVVFQPDAAVSSVTYPSGATFSTWPLTYGGMRAVTYMYTKDKHGFNDAPTTVGGYAVFNTTNSNIKKVSLHSGINELKLSYFSSERGHTNKGTAFEVY